MSDKIIYLALGLSVFGLLLLTYASLVMEPPLSQIGSINTNSIGKSLHVRGSVLDVHKFKGGSLAVTVGDGTGNISVYVDYATAKAMPKIAEAKKLDVVGEIDQYQGALEMKPSASDAVFIIS
jgi:RecJ-like exonuclease